jgi:hypothetical protein
MATATSAAWTQPSKELGHRPNDRPTQLPKYRKSFNNGILD